MTTAHRPTLVSAKGSINELDNTSILHSRMMPAHKKLKYRKGHGDRIETNEELKRRLLEQEEEYTESKQDLKRIKLDDKRYTPKNTDENDNNEEEQERKRRILQEAEDLDRDEDEDEDVEEDDEDDVDDEDDEESEDDEDQEDDDELLMLELAKIKRERAEEEERKLAEAKAKEASRLAADFSVKKSWTSDVAFTNQAKGVDEMQKSREGEFVNDMLRTEFHKKFLNKYVR